MSLPELILPCIGALIAGWLGCALSLRRQSITQREAATEQQRLNEKLNERLVLLTRTSERLEAETERLRTSERDLDRALAREQERNYAVTMAAEDQKTFIKDTQQALRDSFQSLSAHALQKNNESFLDLARTALDKHVTGSQADLTQRQQAIEGLVKPLGASLEKMDDKINQLEQKREGAYFHMHTLMEAMRQTTHSLDRETRGLVSALKSSHTRGRYGEIALRRLVEFAGMTEQCDFVEQFTVGGDNGKLRPDMIIRLPENRTVVVDSKVPLSAYLQMFETEENSRQQQHLADHVTAMKTHLRQLSGKAYWDQFSDAPDFVVLFMQIESSFGAALQAWPEMIEEAMNHRIVVATPTTLITILRSIGYSWNQLKTMENIESIRDAAVEMYERSATLMEHFQSVGRSLQTTIGHYNKTIGSLEGQFLPQGRRIRQLSQAYTKKNLPVLDPVETMVRETNGKV